MDRKTSLNYFPLIEHFRGCTETPLQEKKLIETFSSEDCRDVTTKIGGSLGSTTVRR
jgi:hypothetical protein